MNAVLLRITEFKEYFISSLVPRPHLHKEEKGSGYNTTSRPTLEGRNQIPL